MASAPLIGCGPSYSPDTYASNAAQQAAKVDQGIVVGVRAVMISADTTLATATGAAAGGIAGSQLGEGAGGALGALGGTVAGGAVGTVMGHAAGDTDGYEYIVRKANGDLLSVTQRDVTPLQIGAHVLLIQGPQARIVLDYTVPLPVSAGSGAKLADGPAASKPADATAPMGLPAPVVIVATPLPPPPQQPIQPVAQQPAPPVTQQPAPPVAQPPIPPVAQQPAPATTLQTVPPPAQAGQPGGTSSAPAGDKKPVDQTPASKPADASPAAAPNGS